MDLIYSITQQEDNKSYEGALAVITSACNRAESNWGGYGTDPLSQYTAKGQYDYDIYGYYKQWLNGNQYDYVRKAVDDAVTKGKRNHNYFSFKGYYVEGGEKIGGNWYHN